MTKTNQSRIWSKSNPIKRIMNSWTSLTILSKMKLLRIWKRFLTRLKISQICKLSVNHIIEVSKSQTCLCRYLKSIQRKRISINTTARQSSKSKETWKSNSKTTSFPKVLLNSSMTKEKTTKETSPTNGTNLFQNLINLFFTL